MIEYVLVGHLRPALHAAILFAVGLLIAVPVTRYRLTFLAWPALQVLRLVMWLMGERPSLLRVAAIIWLFNSDAMLIYMASGFHPMLPKVFALWTGLNIGVVMARMSADDDSVFGGLGQVAPGQWLPPKGLALGCGVLVLMLELPCFWYALGMGMSMGWQVQAGGGYLASLGPRATAYLCLIVPTLLVSAIAESIAIRAAAGSAPSREE